MTKFLFTVDQPSADEHLGKLASFDDAATSSAATAKGRLGTGVWLIECEGAMAQLLGLIEMAKHYKLTYKTHLISGDVVEMSEAPKRKASVTPLNM